MPTDLRDWVDPLHYVGRQFEREVLQSALHDAALGTGSVTLVSGTPGIGKSRFLRECAAASVGFASLHAHCVTGPLPGDDLRAQLAALPALLERRPAVVTIDDAHSCGPPDAQTIAAIASMTHRQRIALIVATDAADAHSWMAEVCGWSHVRRVPLQPLDATSMELLVHGLMHVRGVRVDGSAMQEIVDTAAGNPRFAIELVDRSIAAAVPGTLVPASAKAQIDRFRAHAAASSYDVLLLCSTLGERFDEATLAAILGEPSTEIAGALESACEYRILEEDPRSPGHFSFRHPALRKAAYFSTISAKRRLLHQRVVDGLTESARDDALRLADQWIALEDPARAASILLARGDERRSKRDFVSGAEAYQRALAIVESGDEMWGEIARGHVECCDRLGQYVRIIPVVETMRAAPDFAQQPSAMRMLELLFYAYLNECDVDRARGVVEQMSRVSGPQHQRCVSSNLLLAYAFAHEGRRAEASRLFEAVDPAALLDDELCWRYRIAAVALGARRKPLPALLAEMEGTHEIARRLGASARVNAFDEATELALQHGDLAEAVCQAERSMQAAIDAPHVARLVRDSAKCGALVQLFRGDLAAARNLIVEHLHWRDAGRYFEAFQAGIVVAAGVHAGDLPVVDAYFDPDLLMRAVSYREAELCGILLPGFAEIMRARGMTNDLGDALQSCIAHEMVDPYLSIQSCAARYAPIDALDSVERHVATYLRESVTPIAPVHGVFVRAIAARRRGRLPEAERLAREAARGYGRFGWRLRQAASLEIAGELASAIVLFEECGALADAERARLGQRRKLRRAPFGARLTAREAEVARLVARGRSDREIALVLQISVRTVHHHVEAILSKLGAHDRALVGAAL